MLSHRVRAQTPQIHLHTRGDAHEIQIYFKLCYKREAGAADQPRVRARGERTLCNGVVQEQGYKKWEKALSDKHEAKFTRISDDTDVSLLYHTYFLSFFFLQTIWGAIAAAEHVLFWSFSSAPLPPTG